MKIIKLLILAALFALALCPDAVAQEENAALPPQVADVNGAADGVFQAIPRQASELLEELELTDPNMGQKGLSALLGAIESRLLDTFKRALSSGARILTIVVLCAGADSALGKGSYADAVGLCGAVAVSAIAAGDVSAFVGLGVETLYALNDFSKVLLPVMCTAAVSAGAFTSAAAKYAATTLFLDVLISLSVKVLLPMISVYLATVIAAAALGRDMLSGISGFLKWCCTTAMTLLTMAFTAYLGISGLVTGKADEMTLKLAKSAMGTVLPVVGGIISDAAETVVAGAGLIRNTVGVLGLLAVSAICVLPFLTLGAHYLVYKGAAALSLALADKRMSALISGVGTAFGMVLSLVGVGSLLMYFSLISSMRMVGGV